MIEKKKKYTYDEIKDIFEKANSMVKDKMIRDLQQTAKSKGEELSPQMLLNVTLSGLQYEIYLDDVLFGNEETK